MKNTIYIFLTALVFLIALNGCNKKDSATTTLQKTAPAASADTILYSEANLIILPTYNAVMTSTWSLYTGLLTLQSSPDSLNLVMCKQLWLQASAAYEQSDAFQFGPALTQGIDGNVNYNPNIDTTAVDTILTGTSTLNQNYLNNVSPNVKGFHIIEFLLYGGNGNKAAADLTARQLQYLPAMALNIYQLFGQVDSAWVSGSPTYAFQFVYAGRGGNHYTTDTVAYQDLISNMAIMTETDETQKVKYAFDAVGQTPGPSSFVESPFADNSLNDITNNLIGLQNAYLGNYNNIPTNGLSNLVSHHNATFDTKIRNQFSNAFAAVNSITTKPYVAAMVSQKPAVQNLINALDSLDVSLRSLTSTLVIGSYLNK